jgi:RNA polymerase sigma-70 factor (ECF subfamily)
MERACVLLKDVFDYTLEEIADLVDSSVGGVKAALHRGRSKLAALPEPSTAPHAANEEVSQLLRLYVTGMDFAN